MPIKDSNATQNPGALSTGIGIDAKLVLEAAYVESGQYGHQPNAISYIHRIATGVGSDKMYDVTQNHSLKLLKAAADVADGAQFGATGYYNRTGVTVKTGQYAWAVPAAGLLLADGTTEPTNEGETPPEPPPPEPPPEP